MTSEINSARYSNKDSNQDRYILKKQKQNTTRTKPKRNCGKVIHLQTYKIELARTFKDPFRIIKRKERQIKSITMLEIVLLTFI